MKPRNICTRLRASSAWVVINWKLRFNLCTLAERKPGALIGKKSLCSTRAWCESRPGSVRLLGEPLQLGKQANQVLVLPPLNRFSQTDQHLTNPTGTAAAI